MAQRELYWISEQGHGHTAHYLDHKTVTKYIALEPNERMHAAIRKNANKAGYLEEAGTLILLSCGAEDASTITSALDQSQVDTIISILTLCTVPNPENTLRSLVTDVLKPGGTFLFYEHVKSDLKDVAWWQGFWTPLWGMAFDGCKLNRPTHLMIEDLGFKGKGAGLWKEGNTWAKEGESERHLFWHRAGRYVKA